MVVPGRSPCLFSGLRFGGGGLWELREVCLVVDGGFVLSCGFGCHDSLCRGFLLLRLLQFNFVYRAPSVICRVLSSTVDTGQWILVAFWERAGVCLMGLPAFQVFVG